MIAKAGGAGLIRVKPEHPGEYVGGARAIAVSVMPRTRLRERKLQRGIQ
jgi:hypothetical protein